MPKNKTRNERSEIRKEQFRGSCSARTIELIILKVFSSLGCFSQVVISFFFVSWTGQFTGHGRRASTKKEKRSTHLQKSNKNAQVWFCDILFVVLFSFCWLIFFARVWGDRKVGARWRKPRKLMRIPSWNLPNKANKLDFNVRCKFSTYTEENRLTQFIVGARTHPEPRCAVHNAIRLWLHRFLSILFLLSAVLMYEWAIRG